MVSPVAKPDQLRLKWLGIDTYRQPVIFMHRDCHICRSEGFAAQARVRVELKGREIIATLNVIESGLLGIDEAGLSTWAWQALAAIEGESIVIRHPPD